jgi:endoglucanase
MKFLILSSITLGVVLGPLALYHLLDTTNGPASNSFVHQPFSYGHSIRLNYSNPISRQPEYLAPLHTYGAEIRDARDQPVQLRSINWYGASDIKLIASGLDVRHRDDISLLIRRMGFNSVRLPYADELLYANPMIAKEELAANADLHNSSALEVYHAVVRSLTDAGLFVIPNNHITQATWCCGANLCDARWSNDWLGSMCRVRQTEEMWIENWRRVMAPIKENPLVIGADLRNEVRAPWFTLYWPTWASAAERASEVLLDLNPNWLMFVEGMSSANDLTGVRERPIVLSVPGRVVYEAHVYQWSGWGQLSPYGRRNYDSFVKAMRKNWAYLIEEDLAPVWIGEFGTADWPNHQDLHYWQNLMGVMKMWKPSWGYWALNPRKPEGDSWESYGLLEDDWETGKLSEPTEGCHC